MKLKNPYLKNVITIATQHPYDENKPPIPHVRQDSLGAIVRAYKSAVTYNINLLRSTSRKPVWQRNYYEHIILNQSDMDDIAANITSHPHSWDTNLEYPGLHPSKGNP